MKILVVGKDGQVGRYLEQMLDTSGNEVLFLGRGDLDISLKSEVNSTVISFMPNLIVNAAAYTNVENAESDSASAFQVNDLGVANLVSVCERVKASLIHISTDYVFDGKSKRPYTTQDITNPKNAYGKSKVAVIHPSLAATLVHRRSDLRWWIHPFQIILPRHLRHPLPQFLLQIQNRQERGERRVHLACPIRIPAFSR